MYFNGSRYVTPEDRADIWQALGDIRERQGDLDGAIIADSMANANRALLVRPRW